MNPNIAFVGKAGSGKSTASELLRQLDRTYARISFADPLKDIAVQLWGETARTDRDKLQRLGVAVREIEPETWVRLWEWSVARAAPVVTDDLRFENEWWAAKGLGFVIVRIAAHRPTRIDRLKANGKWQDEKQLYHESETAIDHLQPDYYITNDGSKLELAEQIVPLLNREAAKA